MKSWGEEEAGMKDQLEALRAELTALAHATEDPKKVKQAVEEVLPRHLRGVPNFNMEDLEGHYGNPIKLVKAVIEKREWATACLRNLTERFSTETRRMIVSALDTSLDAEGNLFLRLDKQAAFLGHLQLRQDDPIRLKIKLPRGSADFATFKETVGRLLNPV